VTSSPRYSRSAPESGLSRLVPGTYDIVVRDRSRLHNFHLASNSDTTVDFRTDLDFVGEMIR